MDSSINKTYLFKNKWLIIKKLELENVFQELKIPFIDFSILLDHINRDND